MTREHSLKGLIRPPVPFGTKNIFANTKELLTCCTGQEASVEHNDGKVNFILNGFCDNTDTDNDFFHAADVCTLQNPQTLAVILEMRM